MNIRNTWKLSLTIVLVAFFSLSNPSAAGWKLIDGISGKKAPLDISGKNRTYYKLDKQEPVIIELFGPSELKVITRATLQEDEKEGVYSFISYLNDKNRTRTARATTPSDIVENPRKKNQILGESRTIIFDVPTGKNQYKFLLPKDAEAEVFARFLIPDRLNDSEISYIPILPRIFSEEEHITVKEKEYIYYRTTDEKYIELEVVGPTSLKCISRLEINSSMRGQPLYRVQIFENQNIEGTYAFTAQISGTATYSKPASDFIVSSGDVFYLKVPEGLHRYRILTPDKETRVLLRFYIPEDDLGNEDRSFQSSTSGFDVRAFLGKSG